MSVNSKSVGHRPETPLDTVAAQLASAMSQSEAWRNLSARPAAETREALAALTQRAPPGAPMARVEDLEVPVAGGTIIVRLYVPASETPRAAIAWAHGGGFALGGLPQLDGFARLLAKRTGAAVFSIDYRLAPEHPFPTPLEDVVAAIRWVRANMARLLGAELPLFVGGDSAGGNLVTVAAHHLNLAGEPPIAGQLLAYPCTDWDVDAEWLQRFEPPFLSRADMVWFYDQYIPDRAKRRDWRFAPLLIEDLSKQPPAIMVTAEHDVLTEQGEAYAAKLAQAGVPTTVKRYPGQIHGFATMELFFGGAAGAAIKEYAAFVSQILDKQNTR